MKIKMLAATTLLSLMHAGASDLPLTIDQNGLKLYGQEGNAYQFESSTNLEDWIESGDFFILSTVPHTQAVSVAESLRFFRAKALVMATNDSYADTCAEHDNVTATLRGDVHGFSITATHPTYVVTNWSCDEDWSNCPPNPPDTNYPFTPLVTEVFNNGIDIVKLHRESLFWRPYGMRVTVNGSNGYDDIHFVELYRRTPEGDGWPGFFVLYSDGYLRLIPFPPVGHDKVCFGSSVIPGPAPVAFRPYADIESVDYDTSSRTLSISYRTGGSALFDVNTLTRTNAVVEVVVDYPTSDPFCTVRSMFVENGNSDCDTVEWIDTSGAVHTDPVMSFAGTVGKQWLFKKVVPSKHNNSAPDIRIVPN